MPGLQAAAELSCFKRKQSSAFIPRVRISQLSLTYDIKDIIQCSIKSQTVSSTEPLPPTSASPCSPEARLPTSLSPKNSLPSSLCVLGPPYHFFFCYLNEPNMFSPHFLCTRYFVFPESSSYFKTTPFFLHQMSPFTSFTLDFIASEGTFTILK